VLDLSWHVAGPYCTRMLGDYGADVVKVERPGEGDPARLMPPFYEDEPGLERSALFLHLNTNKRSIAVDLASERGREIVLRLAEWADVLVESFSPRVMPALGLDYETLREANPRLVVTSISNFGQSGPYRDWRGSELTLYGMGGPMLNTGSPDREPLKTAGHTPAYQVGGTAAAATSIALWGAEASGDGDHLDVSFFETFMGLIDRRSSNLVNFQYTGDVSARPPVGQNSGSGIWPTGDGGFFFTTVIGPRWPAMAKMIGQEALLEDPRWLDPAFRAGEQQREQFAKLAGAWMLGRSKLEIRQAVEDAGVYGGPVNTIAELLSDPHFEERAFFETIDHPTTGPQTYPGRNYRSSAHGWPPPGRRRAPLLGEHTDEVLGEALGLDGGAIAELRAAGAVS
jgi:crotonobetainyl-CoA:carnitine CoA-transferase CaiB-like acyl-CoA transferase